MAELTHVAGRLLSWLTHGSVPLVILLAFAFWKPALGSRFFHPIERFLARIALHPGRAVLLVGLLAFVLAAATSLLVQMPVPVIHDEFSYLLAADTFANGRLANPPHPMWHHFETFYVLFEPSYASMYPPAQGMALALGQILTGLPIVGSWLVFAVAASAVCWMLMAWTRPRWALLGGLLVAVHPVLFSWSQNFWGGSIAALGGALLLGGMNRVFQRPNVKHSLLAGSGVILLALSRPYEGAVLCLLISPFILRWMFVRKHPRPSMIYARFVVPFGIVMLLLGTWIGYYNHRVMGRSTLMPEVAYIEMHSVPPPFPWQELGSPPAYRVKEIGSFFRGWALEPYKRQRTLTGFIREAANKASEFVSGFFPLGRLGIPVAVPICMGLILLPYLWRHPSTRMALVVSVPFMGAVFLVTWFNLHYAAPITAFVILVGIQGLRHLRAWSWRSPRSRQKISSGSCLARGMVALCILAFAFQVAGSGKFYKSWRSFAVHRDQLQNRLVAENGDHLVFVRYAEHHVSAKEWVWNEADIDESKVVWARDLGETRNRELIEYFKDRRVWLLEADADSPELKPYGGAANSESLREQGGANEHE